MLNFIAGIRPSSPAISSQHLLLRAQAYKAKKNPEEAKQWYQNAVEQAKTEYERNPGDSRAKINFDTICKEYFAFLSELPLSERQEPSVAANPEKSKQVDYLFERALSTLGSLGLSNKTSLFLVYAHDNPAYGKADADTSKYLIKKLSQIRVNLYSDQTPMGQVHSMPPEALKEDGKLEDILTSQLCLLPTQLRVDVEPVDKVVVCCSEVLEKYLKEWPHYESFYQQLRVAYRKDCKTRSTSAIREVVRRFSQEQKYKAGFHHVLTEMAFLQIRAEYQEDQHGIIPVSLTPKSAKECLGHFIPQTIVRMEDIPRFEEQAQAGREVYPNQSRHLVLFKLIERLLVGSHEATTFLNKFWQGYDRCISQLKNEPSMLDGLAFTELVDGIFGDIERELNSQLVFILQHKRKIKELHLPKLSDLREALYEHYQCSNLLIQRVSGETALLDDCYINLAIVESRAQREKDREKLIKQAVTFERLPSGEQLEATNPNKLIALDQLVEVQRLRNGGEGRPKRILVQGRAGIGKTTLCKKLVHEYYRNGLWQDIFDNILWVPLRKLKTASLHRLEDLLCQHYFSGHDNAKAQALAKAFLAHQGKTLFILDGLDEVTEMFSENHPQHHFLKHLLNQSHVLITSRPAGVNAYQCNELDLELETIGFSSENIQAYIQKFAPKSDRVAILQFIKHNPLIQGLVNIPIQLDALCYSWENVLQNQTVTMASIYEAMVNKLWLKDSKRLKKRDSAEELTEYKLEKRMAPETHYLSYLAFKGLETEKIEFSWNDLSECEKELDIVGGIEIDAYTLKKTSILHTINAEEPNEKKRHYHFLHLTFQEFFAAKFLVKHLQAYTHVEGSSAQAYGVQKGLGVMPKRNEVEAFIARHKYHPRYEIIWWMVAGLLKGAPLERFFSLLGQSPRDLIGSHHQQVVMGCLNEARDRLSSKMANELEKELLQWFHFEMKLSNGRSKLARQGAFPERLLLKSLDQSDDRKKNIIRLLGQRPALSNAAKQVLIGAQQDQNKDIRYAAAAAAANALEDTSMFEFSMQALFYDCLNQFEYKLSEAAPALGVETLSEAGKQTLIGLLGDKDEDIRSILAHALGVEGQSILSEGDEQALIGVSGRQSGDIRSMGAMVARMTANKLGTEGLDRMSEALEQGLIGAFQNLTEAIMSASTHLVTHECSVSEIAMSGMSRSVIYALQNAVVNTMQNETMDTILASVEDESEFAEINVSALVDTLQNQDKATRLAAVNTLIENKGTLSEAAEQALISTLQHENWGVRPAAAFALGGQNTLSEAGVHALISALQDQHKNVRSAAVRALAMHIDLVYHILPSLLSSQIETLYTEFLFNYSCKHTVVLYIQEDHQLHFYTATGPKQPIQLTVEQSGVIQGAFKAIQEGASTFMELEEELEMDLDLD